MKYVLFILLTIMFTGIGVGYGFGDKKCPPSEPCPAPKECPSPESYEKIGQLCDAEGKCEDIYRKNL